ncbi:MAG TPA: glycerophosphodiester phosphodiesterase [Lentisphaeria bacterium]|nr:glycerophosphodiester phosphodiesterase [Lentisphaerota bacterium]OQC17460.1 MAG: putative glycerophosphoryl diester phosphodiesterase 1 [Lentisphaerae bacterium ADurb.Bin082]HPY89890.1 glycerophosphodiester phosphodiesterase [Lentisphaeria bacterium]HQL86262.1 glycerophosphodiester phosphodiesterase [Lentisphaeria bacterium]
MKMQKAILLFASLIVLTAGAQILAPTQRTGAELITWNCADSTALPDGWTALSGQWTLRDGKLHGEGCLLAPVEGQDIAIEAHVAILSAREPTRWLGVIGRHQEENGTFTTFTNRFARNVGNGLEIACLGKWDGNDNTWNVLITRSFQDKQPAEAPRLLRLELVGSVARCFIDGQLILESLVPEQAQVSGRPGLYLSGVKVAVSSIRIESLPPLNEQEQGLIREALTGYPLVIAHRGDSAEYPENTLDAIISAVEQRADAVEVDLRCSKDGVPYLFHDNTLDRVTDGKGTASDLTIDELKKLTVTHTRTGRKASICTLEEAILALKEGPAFLHIDLKESRAVPAMAELLKRHNFSERTIVGCSGNTKLISEIREALPRSQIVVICGSRFFSDQQLTDLRSAGASGISIRHTHPQQLSSRQARLHGFVVYNWTINNPGTAKSAWQQGVDGIVTDKPRLIYDELRQDQTATATEPPKTEVAP